MGGDAYDDGMIFLMRMLRRGRGPAMDPLHVSMTGVRMGERFLQIGCNDRALLAGLAAKVGLSGTAAVAALNANEARLAASIGAKVGALIEVQNIEEGGAWPFGDAQFDMVVVDDTGGGFGDLNQPAQVLRHALSSLRPGGRIEVVSRVKSDAKGDNYLRDLAEAGFRPVRVLAEKDGLRFLEGLRTS